MRILHVTSHLNVGGVARSVLTIAGRQRLRGHAVCVASDRGALEPELAALDCEWRPVALNTSAEFGAKALWAWGQLGQLLRRQAADVIHAHTRAAQVACAWVSARTGIPYVTTWHGFFRRNLGRRLWPCTGRLTIAVSEPVREHLMRDFGLPQERIRVIPHGIDAQHFEPVTEAGALSRIRSRFGLPDSAVVVGTVTRLIRARQVDELIRAWAQAAPDNPAAWLLIVGDGRDRQRLQELACRLPCADRVRFIPSVDDTRDALSVMDVFVFLPADKEGFGLVLLEAMAAARAIVSVRRGGGSTWLLEQSGVGKLVEPGNPEALAEAIIPLLEDRQANASLGRHAQSVVRQRYTVERMIDAVEAVYREVVR